MTLASEWGPILKGNTQQGGARCGLKDTQSNFLHFFTTMALGTGGT